MDVREGVVGERFGHAPLYEIGRRVHPGGAQVVDDRARLAVGRVPALLGMDSLEHMAHLADVGRWNVAEYIPVERPVSLERSPTASHASTWRPHDCATSSAPHGKC